VISVNGQLDVQQYNNTKDVKTAIDNTLRVSAPLRPCVKLKNNNAKTQRTKVSGCISLEFSIVPVFVTKKKKKAWLEFVIPLVSVSLSL